jgi:streptogramin lyase
MNKRLRGCRACGLRFALAILSPSAMAIGVAGQVTDHTGQPVAGATITVRSDSAVATITRVFSGADGGYRVPDLGASIYANSVRVSVAKLGYEQQAPEKESLAALAPPINAGAARVDFVLKGVTNLAGQVPASAWIHSMGESPLRNDLVNTCTQCHQMPNALIKKFAGTLGKLDVAQREQIWRAMFAAMRLQFYGALQSENAPAVSADTLAEAVKPENSFINQQDEDLLAPWLAEKFPTNFEVFPLADAEQWTAPLGVNQRTVIRQYAYPAQSFVRETAMLDGVLWVVDIGRNRIGRLDPATGSYSWHDVPSAGAPAPHTLVPDANGNLWVTLLEPEGKSVARFNPKDGSWRVYDGFPKGVAAHDQSPGTGYVMAFDKAGYSWLTLITHNQVIGFHPETGEVTPAYDLPMAKGGSRFHTGVYGGAMSADGNYWFAQNNGGLGRFNTQTRKVDHFVEFERSTGPHRMIVHPDGTLYVSLIGSGQILAYDTKSLKEIKRIDLPDRAASLYSLIWDPVRNALWSGVANTDRLYKYDIKTGTFAEFPTGIQDLHARIGVVDPQTGDLWIANSPIPTNDPEVRWVFSLHPGDIESNAKTGAVALAPAYR